MNNRLALGCKEGAFKYIAKKWEWAEKKLRRYEINTKLLLVTNNEGRTALHLAVRWAILRHYNTYGNWLKKT